MKRSLLMLLVLPLLAVGCASAVSAPAAPLFDTGVSADAWAAIPAGGFVFGPHAEPAVINRDYEMMVTDVTNAQYARYLTEALAAGKVRLAGSQILGYYGGDVFHAHKHEKEIKAGDYAYVTLNDPSLHVQLGGQVFTAQPGYEQHPMVMVTWFGAKAYCDYYQWHLPTELEWEKAARGTDGRTYPWGPAIARGNANYYNSRDPFELFRNSGRDTTPAGFYSGRTYEGYQTLDSASPYGLYDMAGNVWQWTADIYEGQHYRYMRGGSKDTYAYNLRIWTRNSAEPTYASPGVGFRCAR